MRSWSALPLAALAVLALAASAPGPALRPPRFTREQMESALGEAASWRFVYGTRDPAAAARLRERALAIAGRLFGADSTQVRADRDVGEEEIARASVVLIGSPRENDWTRRIAPALPVRFGERSFGFQNREYAGPDDVLHLVYPNPYEPRRFVLLVAANRPEALARRGGGFFLGDEDWRILRAGELVRSGRFAQSAAAPWRYDASLDRDRDAERAAFVASLQSHGTTLRVRAPAALAGADDVATAGAALLARLDALGLGPTGSRPAAPPTLTLYPSLERKGALTRVTRPEHVDESGAAHAAVPAGRAGPDLWSVAALGLVRLGATRESRFLEPCGAWLAGRLEGEPFDESVSRLYFGRVLPTAEQAATRSREWRSPLVWIPARALLARAVFEAPPAARPAARRASLLALLTQDPPGSLDSLCRRAGVEAAVVARRYQRLADSLARQGQRALAADRPRPWRPSDGFQRGVCLAHAVSLEDGYLSSACGRQLVKLRDMGASWISLTPFGYLPSTESPQVFPSADGGPDEESDEAVCEAAARARALGLRVWLTPHLWSRGWPGDLRLSPAEWTAFFDRYREFVLHHALIAERERLDGLLVGHEMPSATAAYPERWRALIADVRRVYTGTMSYGANWDEAARIPFWDALDLVAVSFYTPLAERPTHDVPTLRRGAAKALDGLRAVGARAGRPVLLAEVGYAPIAIAPVRPWEESRGALDLEAQRACYAAVVEALDPADWVAGAFWWKWSTSGRSTAGGAASYSPADRPAQQILVQSLRAWQGRPVRVPAPRR